MMMDVIVNAVAGAAIEALCRQIATDYGPEGVRAVCIRSAGSPDAPGVDAALTALAGTPAAYGQAVNLGSTEQVNIETLARKVITATHSSSRITRSSYMEAYGSGYEDMQRRVPDCTFARSLTGFRPVRTLDTIISDVIGDQTAQRAVAAVSAS